MDDRIRYVRLDALLGASGRIAADSPAQGAGGRRVTSTIGRILLPAMPCTLA